LLQPEHRTVKESWRDSPEVHEGRPRVAYPGGVTRWLDDDEQQVWRAYLAISRKLPQALERQLQDEAGLPHTYYIILAMLSESPSRSLRMSQLAEMVSSSPSRLSHAIDRLSERGWVRRQRASTDRRGNLAVLTEKGWEVVKETAPGHVRAVRENLFDLLSPEQLKVLGEVFETVRAHLDSEAPDRAPLEAAQ
jgi:DNA-binding MarR family transcriptional regulator